MHKTTRKASWLIDFSADENQEFGFDQKETIAVSERSTKLFDGHYATMSYNLHGNLHSRVRLGA